MTTNLQREKKKIIIVSHEDPKKAREGVEIIKKMIEGFGKLLGKDGKVEIKEKV